MKKYENYFVSTPFYLELCFTPVDVIVDTLKEPEKDSTETQGFNEFVFGETGEDVPNTESGRKSIRKNLPS